MRRAGEGSKEGLSSRSWYNRDRVDGDGNQDTHACTRQGRLVHVSVSRQASDWGCGLHIVSDRRLKEQVQLSDLRCFLCLLLSGMFAFFVCMSVYQ